MNKVRDNLGNLFTTIEVKKELLIFQYMDSSILDTIFINLYGEKRLSKMGKLDIDLITDIVINMFSEKWDRAIESFLKSVIDITKGGYKVTENYNSDTIKGLNRSILNKVSAYNDDEDFSDNVEDVEELEGTNNTTNQLEKEVISNIGIDNIIKIMNYLNNYYIYDIMMIDLNELLTLKIY